MRNLSIIVLAALLAAFAAVGVLSLVYTMPRAEAAPASWPATDAKLRDMGAVTAINTASAATAELVAAETGAKTQVIGLFIQSEGAQSVTLLSGTTALTGAIEFADGDSLYLDLSSAPLNCTRAEALNMTTSNATQINGWVVTVTR